MAAPQKRLGFIGLGAMGKPMARNIAKRLGISVNLYDVRAEAMADSALEIVASGRPICDLCHRPKDPEGHMCPHTNGHRTIQEDFE